MKAPRQVQWGSVTVSVDGLSFLDRLFIGVSLAGVLIWAFPNLTLAHTTAGAPLIFKINNFETIATSEDFLAEALAADLPEKIADPRVLMLQQYLSEKRSPLAAYSEILLNQYHYRLILGIAFAESNFCKYQIMPNNCWGIGGSKPERYHSLAEGVIRANNLIQKYQGNGMTTPKLMRNTWVGWPNHNWAFAVEQVSVELESRGL